MQQRRGQLQIAEMLIAATIIMVFIVSLVNLSINISVDSKNYTDNLEEVGLGILESSDQQNLLRPAIYNYQSIGSDIEELTTFIRVALPEYVEFTLYRAQLINNSVSQNTVTLYTSSLTSSASVTQVNYFLTGYYDQTLDIEHTECYQVRLIMWRSIT